MVYHNCPNWNCHFGVSGYLQFSDIHTIHPHLVSSIWLGKCWIIHCLHRPKMMVGSDPFKLQNPRKFWATIWLFSIAMKITIFNGKIYYNGQFPIAMLNYQRVSIFIGFHMFLSIPKCSIFRKMVAKFDGLHPAPGGCPVSDRRHSLNHLRPH
jgi:hypothetical protein